MTYDDLIVKQADAASILGQVKDVFDFKSRPFETIFGIVGTGLAFSFGWVVGILVTASELMGYGPGYIGKLIDDYFKLNGAKTVDNMDLSHSNAKGAANSVTSTVFQTFTDLPKKVMELGKSSFSSTIVDIKEIKGDLNRNDIRSAFYVSMYANPIVKTAKIGHISRFLRLWKSGLRGPIISGAIMKLIWSLIKGMGALGIGSGAAALMGWKTHQTEKKEKTRSKVPSMNPNMKNYTNVSGNVKRTLIAFLDATIANFSVGFMQSQRLANPDRPPVPLAQAPGWMQVEKLISKLNWTTIENVNRSEAFIAPNIQKIARFLLRSVKVSGIKIEKIDSRKPSLPKPTVKPPGGDDEDRLRNLLQGEARI